MKHQKAIYYDREGNRKYILADKLNQDPSILTELKKYALCDVTEEFKLSPVDNTANNNKSHFRLSTSESNSPSRLYDSYDSERHDRKAKQILELLNVEDIQISFIYKDFRSGFNIQPDNKKCLGKITHYKFQEEVTKETEKGKSFARYDIYGIDRHFAVSPKRPEIIMEIVDKNFHNEELFNFLIRRTKETSLIVMYYFLEKEYRYNQWVIKNNKVEFRISCYLKNGQFFYCGIPVIKPAHYLEKEIDNEYRYFNYIEKMVIKQIKKGENVNITALK